MVQKYKFLKISAIVAALALPFVLVEPAFAADGDVARVENFIKAIIKIITGLAGLIAVIFIIFGGIGYMTSSGNPERMDKSKHTLIYALIGLAIVIAAFVISNIVTDLATSAFGS